MEKCKKALYGAFSTRNNSYALERYRCSSLERQASWVDKAEKLFAIGLTVVVVVDAV